MDHDVSVCKLKAVLESEERGEHPPLTPGGQRVASKLCSLREVTRSNRVPAASGGESTSGEPAPAEAEGILEESVD